MKPIINGILASLALLVLYATTMTVLSGWGAAVEQFQALWFLMVPLAISFGVQVGLYTYHRKKQALVSVGGTSAGVSMLACCTHHATDLLPIIGFSGLSIFLSRYQIPLLALSLAINIGGTVFMLKHL